MTSTETKSRPILFSSPMVRAILDGTKTQTRRIIKPQPVKGGPYGFPAHADDWSWTHANKDQGCTVSSKPNGPEWLVEECTYGVVGDQLWVREKLLWNLGDDDQSGWVYCDGEDVKVDANDAAVAWTANRPVTQQTISPIHMPRWASRITLEITGVRVERVHDIGKDGRKASGVLAEGISPAAIEQERKWFHPDDSPALEFSRLWDSINAKQHPWASNPWCWVLEFKRIGVQS